MSRLTFQRIRLVDLTPELLQVWLDIVGQKEADHNLNYGPNHNPPESRFESPFFSPYFSLAVAQSIPQQCFVTIVSRDGRPSGFFPFQYTNMLLGRAERIGYYLSDYNGYISNQALGPLDWVNLLTSSKIHQYAFDHLHKFQKQLGINAEFIREGTATLLRHGFDAYWKEREIVVSRFTKDTVRSANRITQKLGALRFQFHSSDPNDLQDLINGKRRQYRQTGANDAMSSEWAQRCLFNLHAIQNDDFRGVLSKLYAGDTLISSHFGIEANSVLHYWFPVYEPQFAAYSPGRLLFYYMAQQANQHGIMSIDNGMGAQKHKSDFANHTYQLGVGTLRQPSLQCFLLRVQDFLNNRIF